jgi:hypothetical protein
LNEPTFNPADREFPRRAHVAGGIWRSAAEHEHLRETATFCIGRNCAEKNEESVRQSARQKRSISVGKKYMSVSLAFQRNGYLKPALEQK